MRSRAEACKRRERSGQLSLADGLVARGVGVNGRLERIEALLDWAVLEAALAAVDASPVGRPSDPVGVLLRALLLQAWYGLSDPMAEEAFKDRLSFRRFLGVALDEATPDPNTIWRFREELAKRGLAERQLARVHAQLAAKGLVLKQGTLIDASLIATNVAPANRRQDGRPVDPDARWATRKGRSVLGYKMHVAVDEGSGRVLADKADDSAALRRTVRAAGAQDRILHKARRNTPLRPWQRWMNKAVAPARGAVERVFGTAKRSYRCDRARLWNGARNTVDLTVKIIAYNLRRALNLPELRANSA